MPINKNFLRNEQAPSVMRSVIGSYDIGGREGILKQLAGKLEPEEIERLRPLILYARADKDAVLIAKDALNAQIGRLESKSLSNKKKLRKISALEEMMDWATADLRLEKVDASAFHKAMKNPLDADLVDMLHKINPKIENPIRGEDYTIFLVQHDWARAMAGTDVDVGEYRLPSDRCCFELLLSGRRVCALFQCQDGLPHEVLLLLQTSLGWVGTAQYQLPMSAPDIAKLPEANLCRAVLDQVRAIAIMLDADVLKSTIVRAEHGLNSALEPANRLPASDHHVLALNRRPRAIPADPSHNSPIRHVRMHFRRGHWRTTQRFKTWVRWCFAGDPALGFAEKDYEL